MPKHTHRIKRAAAGSAAAFALLLAAVAPAAHATPSVNATVSDDTPYVGEVVTVTVSGQNDGDSPFVEAYVAFEGDCQSSAGGRSIISGVSVSDGPFSVTGRVSFPEEGRYALCYRLHDTGILHGEISIVATESPDCVDARSEYKTAKLKADALKRKIKAAKTRAAKAVARKRYDAAVKVQRAALRKIDRRCPSADSAG